MSVKSSLSRQFGTQFDTTFDVLKSNSLYDKAGAIPRLDFNFAKTKSLLDSRSTQNLITFTRASTATYVDSDMLIKTASTNVPRFDHNPSTGESLGLLVEEARTNFYGDSSSIVTEINAINTNLTPSSNTVIAPDGTQSADQLVETVATGPHRHLSGAPISVVAGQSWTISAFIKPIPGSASDRYPGLRISGGTSAFTSYWVTFDLSTKQTYTNSPAIWTASGIVDYPNGWKRIYAVGVVQSTTASATYPFVFYSNKTFNNVTSGDNYTGDGVSGFYIWGAQLETGSFPTSYIPTPATFTSRASTATYYDANGVIQTAAINEARSNAYFPDENGVFRSAGLLLEATATNIALNSENIVNWAKNGNGIGTIANQVISPDGQLTGDIIFQTSAAPGADRWMGSNSLTITSGVTYTFSCWVKKVSGNDAQPSIRMGFINFSQHGSSITPNVTYEWKRFTATITANSTNSTWLGFYIGWDQNGAANNNVYAVWGFQVEVSSYPTSYIPTTSSTVTRAADISSSSTVTRAADMAEITGANFSSWYNQSEGTVFANYRSFSFGKSSALPTIAHFTDGTLNNYIRLNGAPNYAIRNFTFSSGLIQSQMVAGGNTSNNTNYAVAATFATNNAALYASGNSNFDTSYINPLANKVEIGNWINQNGTYLNGHLSRLTYWPQRLTNTQLQALTAS